MFLFFLVLLIFVETLLGKRMWKSVTFFLCFCLVMKWLWKAQWGGVGVGRQLLGWYARLGDLAAWRVLFYGERQLSGANGWQPCQFAIRGDHELQAYRGSLTQWCAFPWCSVAIWFMTKNFHESGCFSVTSPICFCFTQLTLYIISLSQQKHREKHT